MYKITIEKTIKENQQEQKYSRSEEVYAQLVEELDLEKVIKAINNIV